MFALLGQAYGSHSICDNVDRGSLLIVCNYICARTKATKTDVIFFQSHHSHPVHYSVALGRSGAHQAWMLGKELTQVADRCI